MSVTNSACACSCGDVLLKICGITNQEDADAALAGGASLLGFIFHPDSPRSVAPQEAKCIHTDDVMRVGVFVKQTASEVMDIMRVAGLHLAQLHGDQDEAFCLAIGRQRVMRTFWPQRLQSIDALEAEMDRFAPFSRFFLLDAGTSGGGHGTTQDWAHLKKLKVPRSWFLAGGLSPDNIKDALAQCDPDGVDVNSGVESSPGIKDAAKLMALRETLCSL